MSAYIKPLQVVKFNISRDNASRFMVEVLKSLLLDILEKYSMLDPVPKKDKSQRITVRIWLPSYDKRRKLGHVSIQTHTGGENNEGNHISFWPKESITKRNPFKSTKGEMKSLAHDKIQEEFPPDFKIYLYDLDVEKINQEFSILKEKDIDWWILGSSFLSPEIKKNCAGLTYELLQKGGINQLNYTKTLSCFLAGSLLNVVGSTYIPYSILHILGKNYLIASKTLIPSLLSVSSGFYLTRQSEITLSHRLSYITTLSSITGFGILYSFGFSLCHLMMPIFVFAAFIASLSQRQSTSKDFVKLYVGQFLYTVERTSLRGGVMFGAVPPLLVLTNFIKFHFLDKSLLSPNDVKNFCLLKAEQEKRKYDSLKKSISIGEIPDEKNKKFLIAYEKDFKKIKEIKPSWKDYFYRKTIASKWFIPMTTSVLLTSSGFGLFYAAKKSSGMLNSNVVQANSSHTLKPS